MPVAEVVWPTPHPWPHRAADSPQGLYPFLEGKVIKLPCFCFSSVPECQPFELQAGHQMVWARYHVCTRDSICPSV